MASEKDHKPSSSELLSSAKLVAEAAKSAAGNETDKIDKGKAAGAAADLLDAAQDYGKLDQEKGVGQYVEKAENYLHQYENSNKSSSPAAKPEAQPGGDHGKDSGSGGGGGVGDYFKMAQGFLGK
ncbi:hypothetical protein DITRI_Ditri02bG0181500 [Diplodiscus trichospermus]